MTTMTRLRADFNGVFGGLLCLSHDDTCRDEAGSEVRLEAGMQVTAFEADIDDGQPDDLIASGTVEPSPDWLQCNGSRWALRIDEHGIRHQSEVVTRDQRPSDSSRLRLGRLEQS